MSRALLELDDDDPVAVMEYVDALKLRSCMTLFSLAEGADPALDASGYVAADGGLYPDQVVLRPAATKRAACRMHD